MEKLISSFIENLAINWNDIVDLILDDMICDEVTNLHEIEIARNKINEMNYNSFLNLEYNLNKGEYKDDRFEIDMHEINKILDDYRKEEDMIANKYKIK